jgi:hypothetical protein
MKTKRTEEMPSPWLFDELRIQLGLSDAVPRKDNLVRLRKLPPTIERMLIEQHRRLIEERNA